MESNSPLQFFLKALGCPAVFQKQKFEPGPLAVLAQFSTLAENFGDALEHRNHLVPLHKSIEPHREMRISREPAADAQRETNFGISVERARDRGQARHR